MRYPSCFWLLVLCLGFGLSPLHSEAQVKASPENIMASFIYNFTGYITWSANSQEEEFKIVVLGESPLLEPLKYIAATKKVNERTISLVHIATLSELANCHMIIIGNDFNGKISQISAAPVLGNTLIISHCNGCLQKDASVNFITETERVRFEINKTDIERRKIRVSSQLLKLAVKVI
jgi:hypothetical protein